MSPSYILFPTVDCNKIAMHFVPDITCHCKATEYSLICSLKAIFERVQGIYDEINLNIQEADGLPMALEVKYMELPNFIRRNNRTLKNAFY